ncbi:myb-related protein b [Phtheirospermum japonicum]|uniref:Myb-related protein b n=1 Tax=Phtheirospermum japonicum TaxID=374723 RepID=A0A830BL71_9LAMI|nr:myb-related protein b [Phtheirospermum japonicum]
MKKKVNNGGDVDNTEVPKQKERHIVSWSQEEDDILREQIRVHGTENWAIIASKFKDKTTRQCRRRWFTYLNSDFKKGGWSPEEDMLLCEAQKIFGNRWTEIAKVVSGRTDNAVKNRFTTLCKKRAKHEALAKENNGTCYINLNNKRVIFPNGINSDGGSENAAPLKKMRTYISNITESQEEKLAGVADHLLRPPFAILAENARSCEFKFSSQLHVDQINEASIDRSENNKIRGTFLNKDDPKVVALMQQAELLSSLAIKVNLDTTDQSLESAWTALQDFLKQNKESDVLEFGNTDTNIQLEKFKELVEDLRSSNEGSRPSWREHDVYDSSPASSEYSTGSTLLSNLAGDKTEECRAELCALNQETQHELQSEQLDDQHRLAEESRMCCPNASTNEGKALFDENTRNGVNFCKPEHQSSSISGLQKITPSFHLDLSFFFKWAREDLVWNPKDAMEAS